jgi:hypothetical protein
MMWYKVLQVGIYRNMANQSSTVWYDAGVWVDSYEHYWDRGIPLTWDGEKVVSPIELARRMTLTSDPHVYFHRAPEWQNRVVEVEFSSEVRT